jgi:DNA mismatch repair protein MutL
MLVDEVLHGLACRAAIKAGDPLSREEVDALVRDRRMVRESHHCPHGRPTSLVLSRQDLDRQFRRT